MGAWIEISIALFSVLLSKCRTPRWVRGLKFFQELQYLIRPWSHPTMGAWIEISVRQATDIETLVAPHDGCVD
mgnify:CR=1 FL=1